MSLSVFRNGLILGLVAAIAGCAGGGDDESTGSGNSAINEGQQNGAPTALPESVLISVNNLARDFCTGVLIAPKLVMTATHCTGGSTFVVTAPYAPGAPKSNARVAGVVVHSSNFNEEITKEDIAVLKLDTAITIAQYPELRDVGELGNKSIYGVGVGRDRESRNANLVKSVVMQVKSGTEMGYSTGLQSEYYSSGGDSGGPLFLSDSRGNTQHVVIGIERQPDPDAGNDYFTRIDQAVKNLVAANR